MFNESLLPFLRCMWKTASPEHPETSALELLGTYDNGLLRCHGCGACFLLLDGIPVIVRQSLLSQAELETLKSRCTELC
jgi:hypothetical protein